GGGALLNFETATSHNITVTASDGAGPVSSAIFAITVTDVDPSTPVDSNGAANTIAEGAADGTAVAGFTASSTDPNGPAVVYALSDDAGGRFTINSSTGIVSVATGGGALLNFETATSHNITVTASDGAGPVGSATFTINVTDVAPVAVADGYVANEDTLLTVPVAGVLTNDTDVNGGSLTAV